MDAKALLVEELKKEGLDLAEDAAVGALKAAVRVMPKFFLATENKYDDLLISLMPVLEPELLKLIDKIDGTKDF